MTILDQIYITTNDILDTPMLDTPSVDDIFENYITKNLRLTPVSHDVKSSSLPIHIQINNFLEPIFSKNSGETCAR